MNLKKIGKVVMSKSVGTGRGPRLIKKNLPGRGLTKVEKHWPRGFQEVKVPRFHDIGTGWW
jgi:hypothetical protein